VEPSVDELGLIIRNHWGFGGYRPLQAEAMRCVTQGRDSVVVLPTGGGKSLCFQAPALHLPGFAVVVSPLISLMKDQVDALAGCGVPAACVNSTHSLDEKREVADGLRAGRLKLLYLSPERLMTERTLKFLQHMPVSFFAIDEAHCISDWGHDFRPEYRMLSRLKQTFPSLGVHAYTATATERVRRDIARELRLCKPAVLVGSFDRPNLIYRVQQRTDKLRQIMEAISRHPNESGIIYCIRRVDVDELCELLNQKGITARPYHAGMTEADRKRYQEDFISDRAKIMVATVAFGMGIDKSNVRFVIHAGAPKSLEHYQQESGRAGRDGLEAECCLFYSVGDFAIWRHLQRELPEEAYQIARRSLDGIEGYCSGLSCRRQTILNHFGQGLDTENCGGCDVCLGEVQGAGDELVLSQKIISAVLRLKGGFGIAYVVRTLVGSRDQRIIANGHDQLSTYGLLADYDRKSVRFWIDQLIRQNCLEVVGDYPVLRVTPLGGEVLKGEFTPRLLKRAEMPAREAQVSRTAWEGVDRGLFEALCQWRLRVAEARDVPPFVIFADTTLRELARRRPSTIAGLRTVHGIGETKLAEYGAALVELITAHCRQRNLDMDAAARSSATVPSVGVSGAKRQAFALFAQGKSIETVMRAVNRARSTATEYLADFIQQEGITDPSAWLEAEAFAKVRAAAAQLGIDRLKPIYDAQAGAISYDQIRIALACLRNESEFAAAGEPLPMLRTGLTGA
jgi:ATP-dependent DNA helicase RecQ